MTDFGKIPQYASYVAQDPFRHGLQFPAVLNELGGLTKRVLDVGTGDGLFSRLMARAGAVVVAYDKSPEKIAEARAHEDAQELGVKYVVATPRTFTADRLFDAATSVMVLPYASDLDEMGAFFHNTSGHLVPGGKFVSTVLNPGFSSFERNLGVRRVKKLAGNLVQMEFLSEASGAIVMSPIYHQYSREEYESVVAREGMRFEWKRLSATPEALMQKGEAFWRPCHETEPYVLLIARNDY